MALDQFKPAPELRGQEECVEIQRRVRQALFDLRNQLTVAPIRLPHRNALRDLLSVAYRLTDELGTDQTRVDEAHQKLQAILEHLSR
jgi:hypothetical protein